MRARTLAWIGALAVAGGFLIFGAVDPAPPRTNADRAYALAKDFACPVCQGQSVAESDVPVAREIRRQIAVWVEDSRSETFIRDELVSIYGEDIDYNPSASGITSLVWIVPVVAGIAAFGGLVIVFRGWRIDDEATLTEDDVALVESVRRRNP